METKCPICAAESVVVAKLTVGEMLKCPKCGWLFTQNVPVNLFYKGKLTEEKKNEYLAIVQKASDFVQLGPTDKVLDINSGDGTLLGWYLKNIVTVGVEPNAALMKEALNAKRVDVPIVALFNAEEVKHVAHVGKFKIITIIDVFQDHDVRSLLLHCRELLAPDGVIIVQAPYLPELLIEKAENFILSQNYILACTLQHVCMEVGLMPQGGEFPKKNIRCYITHLGFNFTEDYDMKLKLHMQMSNAFVHELYARYDLDDIYKQLEHKLHPQPLGIRNVDQTTPK